MNSLALQVIQIILDIGKPLIEVRVVADTPGAESYSVHCSCLGAMPLTSAPVSSNARLGLE